MMPGDLHTLVERCRADEAPAWEHFAAWVQSRGRALLGAVGGLNPADREDAIAEALKNLVAVVRRGGIRGVSNAEIDAYVCTAVRHRALNLLRERGRRRAAGEVAIESRGRDGGGADMESMLDDQP